MSDLEYFLELIGNEMKGNQTRREADQGFFGFLAFQHKALQLSVVFSVNATVYNKYVSLNTANTVRVR